jgi:sporulation protein YlmC with PRC-barrel domain
MFGKDVFTSKGYYAGRVADVEFDLGRYKVRSLVVEASKGSVLGKMVGGKRGIIVPYPIVQAIGDVVIIKHVIDAELAAAEEQAQGGAVEMPA